MSSAMDGYRCTTKAIRVSGPISEHDLQQTARQFQNLYDNGVLFYERQHMRRISRQLADATTRRTADLIRVDGLDGEPVDFEVQIGKVSPSIYHGLDQVALFAFLSYKTPERLCTVCGDDPSTAYCTIRIMVQVATLGPPTGPIPSLEVTRAMWNRQRQAWHDSESFKHLRDTLTKLEIPKVLKVVGFALGCFETHDTEDINACRSSRQHALALSLRDLLQSLRSDGQVPCYVQDTAYRDIDKAILSDSDLSVLDDPNGFLEVDDESAVLSLYSNCPVKEIVRDLAIPALIIWDAGESDDVKPDVFKCDPLGSRVKKWLHENYNEYSLSLDDENFGPCEIGMYIRRERKS